MRVYEPGAENFLKPVRKIDFGLRQKGRVAAFIAAVFFLLFLLTRLPGDSGRFIFYGIWAALVLWFSLAGLMSRSTHKTRWIAQAATGPHGDEAVAALRRRALYAIARREARIAYALALRARVDYLEAGRFLGRIRPTKRNAALVYLRGLNHQSLQEWGESVGPLAFAAKRLTTANAHLSLATSYFYLDSFDLAEGALFDALAIDKENKLIYYSLGCVYSRKGDGEQAGRFFAFFLTERDGGVPAAYYADAEAWFAAEAGGDAEPDSAANLSE